MAEPTITGSTGSARGSDRSTASTPTIGPVLVRLPPEPALSRVLRLAASGIAAMAGFTVDETEDIKIAVSEVLLALIEHGEGDAIEVGLSVENQTFDIRASTSTSDFDVNQPDLMLCRTVLAGVCTHHSIELDDGRAQIHAQISAQISAPAPRPSSP